jgi:hypothetical protein
MRLAGLRKSALRRGRKQHEHLGLHQGRGSSGRVRSSRHRGRDCDTRARGVVSGLLARQEQRYGDCIGTPARTGGDGRGGVEVRRRRVIAIVFATLSFGLLLRWALALSARQTANVSRAVDRIVADQPIEVDGYRVIRGGDRPERRGEGR